MTKKMAVLIIIVALSLSFFACADNNVPQGENSNFDNLRFDENGQFTILHLADLHETVMINSQHESEGRTLRETLDAGNVGYINFAIDKNKPNLVVLGGDNLFCKSAAGEIFNKEMEKTIIELCKLFDGKQVLWTFVFGNHDDESYYANKEKLVNTAVENSKYFVGGLADTDYYCSFVDKTTNMYGNYAIPILNNARTEVAYNIFTFDSGSWGNIMLSNKRPTEYNYIRSSQVEWYSQTSQRLTEKNGTQAPAIAFTHIPLFEHNTFYENRNDTAMVSEWTGEFGGYSLSDTQSEIYKKMLEVGDVKAIFTGHNHSNSVTMRVNAANNKQMLLSTTRQCSNENSDYQNNPTYGYSRVIKLFADKSLTTYEFYDAPLNSISIA